MKVCGVYDESSEDYVEEIKQIADYCIYDFPSFRDMNFKVKVED